MDVNAVTIGKGLIWLVSEAYTVTVVGVQYTENVTELTLQIFQLLLTIEAPIVQDCLCSLHFLLFFFWMQLYQFTSFT